MILYLKVAQLAVNTASNLISSVSYCALLNSTRSETHWDGTQIPQFSPFCYVKSKSVFLVVVYLGFFHGGTMKWLLVIIIILLYFRLDIGATTHHGSLGCGCRSVCCTVCIALCLVHEETVNFHLSFFCRNLTR